MILNRLRNMATEMNTTPIEWSFPYDLDGVTTLDAITMNNVLACINITVMVGDTPIAE
jgi:hypothetical protein